MVIRDCTISENNTFGIELDSSDSLVIGNNLAGNNAANMPGEGAIYITGSNNRIENNHVTGSGPAGNGILIFNSSSITNNVVIKNSVEGGGANNYSINTNYNDVGPIGSASTNTSPWGNISH
jgi:parallel beta-helix repeat protein